jgi:NB-ARC domain
MNNRQLEFGSLLREGIASAAHKQALPKARVESDLANSLGYSVPTIQRWQQGYLPKEPEDIEAIIRYCLTHGRMNRDWAIRLLDLAHHSSPSTLLAKLFPNDRINLDNPRVYHNLPPRYGDIIGRRDDLQRVLEGMASRWPVISIEGLAGVGKTTLALEAAYRSLPVETAHRSLPVTDSVLGQPFDSVVWTSATRQLDQQLRLGDVLDVIANVQNYPGVVRSPLEQKQYLVDNLLREKRTLIVIDNFETIMDKGLVNWMLRVPEPTKVLITSRHAQFHNVWEIDLKGLKTPDALEFIRTQAQRLGLRYLAEASDLNLSPLVYITAGNPLALEMAIGYLKNRGLTLPEMVEYLHHANPTINSIFDSLFAHTWNILAEDARRLLLSCTLFVSSVRKETLGSVCDLTSYSLDTALAQLVETSLLEPSADLENTTHYNLHPLTRSFAYAKLQEIPEWEQQMRKRWANYYEDFVARYGGQDRGKLLQSEELESEWLNISSVVDWMHETHETDTNPLAQRLPEDFMYTYGHLWQSSLLIR